jgi:heme/copper-type cytochrome/quinol oxidase subunit 2
MFAILKVVSEEEFNKWLGGTQPAQQTSSTEANITTQ